MLQPAYNQLVALARRAGRNPREAEDLLQDALIAALLAGRGDLSLADNRRWLAGVIRNKARLYARSGRRRRIREAAWDTYRPEPATVDALPVKTLLAGLPPALRSVAALALSGHTRHEIAYLLKLEDAALRQRVAQLRKRLIAGGLPMPDGLPGLGLDLAYGRIRDALLPELLRNCGVFASHDPDGHLFVIRRAQPG